jgi:hypothetical protein
MNYIFYERLIEELKKFNFRSFILKNKLETMPFLRKTEDNQTWFDISDGILKTDETIPSDQEDTFPTEFDYQVIKFFNKNADFYLDDFLQNKFSELNNALLTVDGLEYVHVHSMKNFIIQPHVDGNIVLIINLTCPTSCHIDNFGFSIDNNTFQPKEGHDIWLDTNLIHSVWNYTNEEWKFLTISINKDFLINCI